MRLLLIAPEFPPSVGGMATNAARLSALLSVRGHEVRVLTERQNSADRAAQRHAVVTPCLRGRYAADVRRIRREMGKWAADAVLLGNAGFARLALETRVPVVARTVGNDVYSAWIGPALPLRFLAWRLPGPLGARLRALDQQRRTALIAGGLRRCEAVMCNSAYTRARLAEMGLPPQILHVVPGGVDTDAFRPAEPARRGGEPDSEIILGAAGNLKPIKGFHLAIEALARLAGEWPGLSLLIAGEGGERPALERRAAELGIGDRVRLLGDLSLEEMPAFYRRLDLYLQPSVPIHQAQSGVRLEESMGRALAEAQASGLPVIGSRSGGIPEMVDDGNSGLIVEHGDAGALAAAINSLLRQPDLRARMGAAARSRAVEHFSWEAVVAVTEALLTEAVRRHRQTSATGVPLAGTVAEHSR